MNKLIIISGCSGGGKSTLLSELNRQGYSVMPEVGREVYREKLQAGIDVTTWENQKIICEEIIKGNVTAYHQAQAIVKAKDQKIFFDRSFLDCVSYYQELKVEDSHKYDNLIEDLRYYPTILITPPWKEIYCQDEERKHSFEDAITENERSLNAYIKYGYQLLEIPKLSMEERLRFVLCIDL